MRSLKLYIACSLDGYIAREDGAVDWLFTDGDYGYKDFYTSIDTTLMGYKTYEQVLTFGDFPYLDKENIVFTRQTDREDTEFVRFVNEDIPGYVEELKAKAGKDIWLIGGTQINDILMQANAIDEYLLFIHPIILGNGIPLFKKLSQQIDLKFLFSENYPNGMVQLRYGIAKL